MCIHEYHYQWEVGAHSNLLRLDLLRGFCLGPGPFTELLGVHVPSQPQKHDATPDPLNGADRVAKEDHRE